ncbi:unnamed protein product [Diplocarpon coronariae]
MDRQAIYQQTLRASNSRRCVEALGDRADVDIAVAMTLDTRGSRGRPHGDGRGWETRERKPGLDRTGRPMERSRPATRKRMPEDPGIKRLINSAYYPMSHAHGTSSSAARETVQPSTARAKDQSMLGSVGIWGHLLSVVRLFSSLLAYGACQVLTWSQSASQARKSRRGTHWPPRCFACLPAIQAVKRARRKPGEGETILDTRRAGTWRLGRGSRGRGEGGAVDMGSCCACSGFGFFFPREAAVRQRCYGHNESQDEREEPQMEVQASASAWYRAMPFPTSGIAIQEQSGNE